MFSGGDSYTINGPFCPYNPSADGQETGEGYAESNSVPAYPEGFAEPLACYSTSPSDPLNPGTSSSPNIARYFVNESPLPDVCVASAPADQQTPPPASDASAAPAIESSPESASSGERRGPVVRLIERLDQVIAGAPEGSETRARAEALRQEIAALDPSDAAGLEALKRKVGDLLRETRTTNGGSARRDRGAEREAQAVERLRSLGVLTPEIEMELEEFRSFNGSAERIRDCLLTAAGYHGPDEAILARNHIEALRFELARRREVALSRGVDPATVDVGARPVEHHAMVQDGDGVRLVMRRSTVLPDIPELTGHDYEVKRSARRNYGETEEGTLDLRALNQAIRYNQDVVSPDSGIQGATIEVRGNVSPEFITELARRAPEVEVLYNLQLPSGGEVVFRIKAAPDGRPTLRRVPDIRNLPEADQVVVNGVSAALRSGRILRDGVLENNFLRLEDIPRENSYYEIFSQAAGEDGAIDPMRITSLEAFQEWERLITERRYRYFSERSADTPRRRSVDHLMQPVTDEAVDRYIAEAQRVIERSPEHTRRQYTVAPADAQRVRAEFARRLSEIQHYEFDRLNSPEETLRQAERAASGYAGPVEGYPLDFVHIYQDVVKGLREESRRSRGDRGTALPLGLTEPLPARSYDRAETILTAEQVLSNLLSPDSEFARTSQFMRVVSPEAQAPDVGEQITNTREYDVTEEADCTKLLRDIHRRNVGRLAAFKARVDAAADPARTSEFNPAELRVLHAARRALTAQETTMQAIDQAIDRLRAERNGQIKMVDQDSSIAPRDRGARKRAIADEYDGRIRLLEERRFQIYERALGTERYRRYFEYVAEVRSSDELKFIYTIDSEGTVRMVHEELRPGSERPAHSQLSGGRNVYAAGQVWISGTPVTGPDGQPHIVVRAIDDGSGHYRPGTFEMLPYAKQMFERAGFDTSNTAFKHAPLPFAPLDDRFDVPYTSPLLEEGAEFFPREAAPGRVDESEPARGPVPAERQVVEPRKSGSDPVDPLSEDRPSTPRRGPGSGNGPANRSTEVTMNEFFGPQARATEDRAAPVRVTETVSADVQTRVSEANAPASTFKDALNFGLIFGGAMTLLSDLYKALILGGNREPNEVESTTLMVATGVALEETMGQSVTWQSMGRLAEGFIKFMPIFGLITYINNKLGIAGQDTVGEVVNITTGSAGAAVVTQLEAARTAQAARIAMVAEAEAAEYGAESAVQSAARTAAAEEAGLLEAGLPGALRTVGAFAKESIVTAGMYYATASALTSADEQVGRWFGVTGSTGGYSVTGYALNWADDNVVDPTVCAIDDHVVTPIGEAVSYASEATGSMLYDYYAYDADLLGIREYTDAAGQQVQEWYEYDAQLVRSAAGGVRDGIAWTLGKANEGFQWAGRKVGEGLQAGADAAGGAASVVSSGTVNTVDAAIQAVSDYELEYEVDTAAVEDWFHDPTQYELCLFWCD